MAGQPDNINFLSGLAFRFNIQRLPTVNYFAQACVIPSINVNPVETFTTPHGIIPLPGDRLVYEPFNLRFRVDEDLQNYMEIEEWLVAMGKPESFKQTLDFVEKSPVTFDPTAAGTISFPVAAMMSDATLTILTSAQNPNISVTFEDAFPISLTELSFDATNADIEYLETTVTFRYRKYSLARVT